MADIEQQVIQLPPLPKPEHLERGTGMGAHDVYYSAVAYTEQQMRDYALAALASQPQAQTGWSAEDACEQFIAAEIDAAPDCLRRLGEWLCNVLDEDGHKTAAAMVMGAILETSAAIREAQAPAAAVPDGMKLVPTEPTPEIIAAAAIAVWPTASPNDVAMARIAAGTVLMEMDAIPGLTIDVLAGILATMAPAYRAMVAAAPAPEVSDGG